ncbi:hypothetical protein AAAB92_27155 [Pseudomonas aeruginosa]
MPWPKLLLIALPAAFLCVVRQLETARQRAAKATTGGLDSTVPDPGGGD